MLYASILYFTLKDCKSAILSDPPCKNARFTRVPLKALSAKNELDIHVFVSLSCLFLICGFIFDHIKVGLQSLHEKSL